MDFFKELMHREQQDKLERYRILNQNVKKGEILFTGSSLMEQFPVNELLMTNGISRQFLNFRRKLQLRHSGRQRSQTSMRWQLF